MTDAPSQREDDRHDHDARGPSGRADGAPGHEDRFLPLHGTLNTRDLGGLDLVGGGRTRLGVMLRSDVPMELTEADLRLLQGLPLTTVIDLRQAYELERDPSRLARLDHVAVHNVEIWGHIDGTGDEPADRFDITAFYVAALDHAGPGFARAVRILAEAEGAALFHCTAGKDRTGLLAALVLETVGVDRATVIADFALTHDRIGPLRERLLIDAEARGIPRTDFVRLLGATPDLIGPALRHLDARYGGAVAYLRRAGVDDVTLEKLRAKLTG